MFRFWPLLISRLVEKLSEKLIAEAVGTSLLLVAVVGSGAAVDRLAQEQAALALFVHSSVVGASLVGLIASFGNVSAHFNPAVSLFFALRGELPWSKLPLFIVAQVVGAVLGVVLTHAMFDLPLVALGTNARTGFPLWLSEAFCTFALVVIIAGAARQHLLAVAVGVGAFISGAIWCFSSAAFANPAVTIARSLTDSYTAIRPVDVLPFIVAQVLGAGVGSLLPGFRPDHQVGNN